MGVPGPWYARLPHFRMEFTPGVPGEVLDELQSEYFVPRHNAVEAILAVEQLRDQITPHLWNSEIRTVASDNLWMSTCYQRPSVAIHFTWRRHWPEIRLLLPIIERVLYSIPASSSLGKAFHYNPGRTSAKIREARRVYPARIKIRP